MSKSARPRTTPVPVAGVALALVPCGSRNGNYKSGDWTTDAVRRAIASTRLKMKGRNFAKHSIRLALPPASARSQPAVQFALDRVASDGHSCARSSGSPLESEVSATSASSVRADGQPVESSQLERPVVCSPELTRAHRRWPWRVLRILLTYANYFVPG